MKYTPGRWAVCTLGSRGGSCCGQAGDEQREGSMGLQALCAGAAGARSTSPMGSGGISSDSTARGFAPVVINGNYSASYAVIQGNAQRGLLHITWPIRRCQEWERTASASWPISPPKPFSKEKLFVWLLRKGQNARHCCPLGRSPPPVLTSLHCSLCYTEANPGQIMVLCGSERQRATVQQGWWPVSRKEGWRRITLLSSNEALQQLSCLFQQCLILHALIRRNRLIFLTSFSLKWVIDISHLCTVWHG